MYSAATSPETTTCTRGMCAWSTPRAGPVYTTAGNAAIPSLAGWSCAAMKSANMAPSSPSGAGSAAARTETGSGGSNTCSAAVKFSTTCAGNARRVFVDASYVLFWGIKTRKLRTKKRSSVQQWARPHSTFISPKFM